MIGCLFIPEYPAWSLQYMAKHHRNDDHAEPIAVVDAGTVISTTRNAQRKGVMSGMPYEHAQKTAPDVTFKQRAPRTEAAVWVDVMQGLSAHTPRIKPVDTGHAYFEPVDVERLQAHIDTLQVQAALAPDRPAARLGALQANAGELCHFTHREVADFLDRFRTERLLQLGYPLSMVDQLGVYGYDTLGPLQSLSRRWLDEQFGSHGTQLHALLHPSRVDRAPVPLYTAPDTVMRSARWKAPTAYWETLQPMLSRLLSQAVSALGAKTCQRITVQTVNAKSGRIHRASRILQTPTRERSVLSPVAHVLLRDLTRSHPEVEALRVVLGVLSIPEVYPDVFFRQRRERTQITVPMQEPEQVPSANGDAQIVFDEDRSTLNS